MRISDWSSDVCSSDLVLNHVRSIGYQVSTVVQVVFWFAFAAGVLVLLAAIGASQDERLQEGGVMRVLGGSRGQLRLAQASEFAAIGLLAGLVAAIAASVLSGVVAREVFDLPWQPNRSEEHTSELQSLMRISYAVFCL